MPASDRSQFPSSPEPEPGEHAPGASDHRADERHDETLASFSSVVLASFSSVVDTSGTRTGSATTWAFPLDRGTGVGPLPDAALPDIDHATGLPVRQTVPVRYEKTAPENWSSGSVRI